MRLFFGILVTSTILHAATTTRVPAGTEPFSKSLEKYRRAATIGEKLGYAQEAWSESMSFRSNPAWKSSVNSDVVRSLSEVERYVRHLDKLMRKFENELYPDELAYITQDALFSVAKMAGRVNFTESEPQTCSRLEYEKLREKVPFPQLKRRASQILVRAKAQETINQASYIDRAMELVKSRPKYRRNQDLLLGHLEWQKTQLSKTDSVPVAVNLQETFRWVKKSPSCLGGSDPTIVRWMEEEQSFAR